MALDASRWRVYASFLPPEIPTVEDTVRAAWSAGNCHRHAHREIMVALSGKGVYGAGGRLYSCDPGSVFFFGHEEEHDCGYPPFAPDADHIWMGMVGGSVLGGIVSIRRGRYRHILKFEWSEAVRAPLGLLESYWAEAESEPFAGTARCRAGLTAALSLVLLELLRVRRAGEADVSHLPSPAERAVRVVAEHIRETGGRGCDLRTLADLAGYDRFYFLRLFKRCIGRTVHQYVDECRRVKVAEWTAAGRPQKEIAAALGFSSPAVFSRWKRLRMR